MEAQGGAGSPEPNKDIQKLLKPSSSAELSRELFHCPLGAEEGSLSGPTASLLHISDQRKPLSSVSSLEVHFDLLDLTDLTDMSDQELAEVFVDSDEENHNDSPADKTSRAMEQIALPQRMFDIFASHMAHGEAKQFQEVLGPHQPMLPRGGYMRSPSWSHCSKAEQPRERKHHSDSDTTEPLMKLERPKQP